MESVLQCPNCTQMMEQRRLERYVGAEVAIDFCFRCHVIWFDRMESPQLAPDGVIELLQLIRQHRQEERPILREQLDCPHCRSPLLRTDDLVKSGRIRYYRCPNDGGRLTPFLQFLIEKQFVRALTPKELGRLRLDIRQASCSGCGAPIDLARQDHCEHCLAPIAVLDADTVERAARAWSERAEQRADGRAAAERAIAHLRNIEQWHHEDRSDLLMHSIAIFNAFRTRS